MSVSGRWIRFVVLLGSIWPAATLTVAEERHDVVPPPSCLNNKGEAVTFKTTDRGRAGLAAGMAIRDPSAGPVVMRSNFASAPGAFQKFIDRHECAHHQIGDVDRPHPPRNSPEHLMNEAIADCIAVLRLRDEEAFDAAALAVVTDALRADMTKIGFPEVSVSSRLRNMGGCSRRDGSAEDLISAVLKERGLR